MLKVLALAPYPDRAAATRFRLSQFVEPLGRRGIDLQIRPMMDDATFAVLYEPGRSRRVAIGLVLGAVRRLGDVRRARASDVVVVQREALVFGPPLLEWLIRRVFDCPVVLDLDDATWVGYDSPTYGRIGRWLKWPGKSDQLIKMATAVTCGNEVIQEHVVASGQRAIVVHPVVDTDRFCPVPGDATAVPVIGWIGSHSTQPYVEELFGVLEDLSRTHRFRLRLVGVGSMTPPPTLNVEGVPWELDREVVEFQSLDIGLYPLPDDEWARGKAGLKAIQYMAVGRPFVVSAGAAAADLGVPGTTHFVASTSAEWRNHLELLLDDCGLRARMGEAGREYVLQHLPLECVADTFAEVLHDAARGRA
jgi:glycosyltransferase involved in cell wall biosynthesis